MDAADIDDERSQDVENILRQGDEESFYNDSGRSGIKGIRFDRNRTKYYGSLCAKYKSYIIGLVFFALFSISLTIGISLSRPDQSTVTEELVSVDGATGKKIDTWTGTINSNESWDDKNAVRDPSSVNTIGGDKSNEINTPFATDIGRTGGAGSNVDATSSMNNDFLDVLERKFNEMDFPDQHFLSFDSSQSPQSQALRWMTENDKEYNTSQQLSDERNIQRYALVAFFYATYAVTHPYLDSQLPWRSADKWLSSFNECEWEGITCDPSINNGESVTSIVFADNRISGTPSLDLGLLGSTLHTLVLSKNLIYMEGNDLDMFGYLTKLKDLKIDDNYIYSKSGLPRSLQNLHNLERIILAYNLLQGQIPSNYFENLSKLSHLDIESNYVTGAIPSSLLQTESLVYLYMRKNNVMIKFDELITSSNWPKIFSLWLDSNNITGTIPAEIGRMTGLASLSMTNANVTGTIPKEIGQLSDLRRLWLYNNKLSGQIPQELGDKLQSLEVIELYGNDFTGEIPMSLCTTIEKSTYRFKELSADCQKVECTDCCTKCY